MQDVSSSNCDDVEAETSVDVRAVDNVRTSQNEIENSFSGMEPFWVLVLLTSIPIVAVFFWWLGAQFFASALNLLQYLEFAALLTAVVTGGYQLYFWVQRHNHQYPTRCFKIALDDQIPFWPRWIWIYSFLYYVMIGLTVVSIGTLNEGVHLIFGGLMLLLVGTTIFYFFPTDVPDSFRHYEVTGFSTRYTRFVQSFDNSRNAFPSMHCAIGVYVGLVVAGLPTYGPLLGYGFIVLLTVSCLVVKQHVIIDTITGLALGYMVFEANQWLGMSYL
ncbi:phosphatase PAP2 family protein [Kaarinaea lacus]